ncbi:MAG: putative glutathione S-transferase [Rhodospirillales bacterium]|jgi:glutathione S-transferase|nr:putative glutathione S-transferase [Rhodospirillales bacterium]
MTDFIVYGIPGSPYLRKVLLGLEEKNLPWRLSPLGFGEHKHPAHVERHPFGRIPVVDHGDFRLYEAQAILRYLDRIAPEPPLTPSDDPRKEARMNQICGIVDSYLMNDLSAPITFARVVAPKFGLPVDEAKLEAALPRAAICMAELSRLLGEQDFMAGDAISIADLMLAPHLAAFAGAGESKPMFARQPNLRRWLERMNERPSMQATTWERVTEIAQAA